jgi:hypothetical protein
VFMCVCVWGSAGGGDAAIVQLCAHIWQDLLHEAMLCMCDVYMYFYICVCIYTHTYVHTYHM